MYNFYGNIVAGSKQVSVPVLLKTNPGGADALGITIANISATYWRDRATPVPIGLTALTDLTDSWISGGWLEKGEGSYRLDIPNNSIDTGAQWVIITVAGAGLFTFNERYNLEPQNFVNSGVSGITGSLTDSYVTITGADNYFETNIKRDVWQSYDSTDKQIALIEATRLIDQLNYKYLKTDASQNLEFPRNGSTNIPDDVKFATCEAAVSLLDGFDPNLEIDNLPATGNTFSTVKRVYDRTYVQEWVLAGIPSARAWAYLKKYLCDPNEFARH